MVKRTLGDIREKIARTAGVTGLRSTDSRVAEYINEATEELMIAGDWPGVVDRYIFNVTDGDIVCPYFLDQILGFTAGTNVYDIKSPWYEFVEYGPGPKSGFDFLDNVLDRGEVCVTKQIPSDGTSYTLFTKGFVDEQVSAGTSLVRPEMTVMGLGSDGRRIRTIAGSAWIDGEIFEINGDTPPYTYYGTTVFSEVTSVIKPETNGYVELWATNGTDQIMLSAYDPEETTPSYRRYFLPVLANCGTIPVLVRARKRFIPVEEDSDTLIISNLPALKAMVQAIVKRETQKWEEYAACRAFAINIMREEAAAYRPSARTPGITIQRGFSIGDIPFVR